MNHSQVLGAGMASAFSCVFAQSYLGSGLDSSWIAVAPSSQNLAIDRPARHSGSSSASAFMRMYLICSHPPSSSMLFCAKTSNVLAKLSNLSIALVSSSRPLGTCARTSRGSQACSTASPPRNALNSFQLQTKISSLITNVGAGGSNLWLNVSGARMMRAASAVTTGSIEICSRHSPLNISAYTFHSSLGMSSSMIQQACTPPPESISTGSGNPAFATSLQTAMCASSLPAQSLCSPTSRSMKNDRMKRQSSAFLLNPSNVPRATKVFRFLALSLSTCSITSSSVSANLFVTFLSVPMLVMQQTP